MVDRVDPVEADGEENPGEEVGEGLRWLGLHTWVVLLLLLAMVGSAWVFVGLADEVVEQDQELARLDEQLLLALREPEDRTDPLGPAWLESAVRDVTAMGGGVVLLFLTLSTALFLWLRGNRRTAVVLLVAIGGGFLWSELFKELIARPRPGLVPPGMYVPSFSFPSGHSMASAATYLTLGALLARTEDDLRLKVYVMALAVLVTLAVGFSRVYLGVHWPSDVLGGWTAGTVWALVVWVAARWLRLGQER
jgi:undecaprenyl-diphosphatase